MKPLLLALPILTPLGLTLAVAQTTSAYGLLETIVGALMVALFALVAVMGVGVWAGVSVLAGLCVQWALERAALGAP